MPIELELAFLIPLAVVLYAMPADDPSRTDLTSTWKFPTKPMMESSNAVNAPVERPESPEDMIGALPVKKPSAAVYPLMAGRTKKPFSRSAQKRQSVQMLGSIEHLQHHFSKIGLTSKKPPPSKLGALPAIGPGASSPPRSPLAGPVLPPSPARPAPPTAPAYLLAQPIKIDPQALRCEAVHALNAVVQLWDLPRQEEPRDSPSQTREVLEVLKCTVAAIRAVRAFSLSLPASAFKQSKSTSGFLSVPTRQSISTTSRPSLSVVSGSRSSSGSANGDSDPLVDVRKSALEVLVSLRAIEERCRIEDSNNVQDEGSDFTRVNVDGVSSRVETPPADTTISTSTQNEPSHDDEAEYYDGVNFGTEHQELRKTWEEKLASGEEGWLYRSDVDLVTEFPTERAGVRAYLETVEDVLFGAGETYVEEHSAWAWVGNREQTSLDLSREPKAAPRRTSGNERIESWMQENWEGKELERLHDFLLAHLPLQLQILIPQIAPSGDTLNFLARLADGYLVALAFNTAIERSDRPWGLISGADVHDTLENVSRESDAKDWTFRRAENLTSLAAAMRHRYNIPIHIPTSAPSDVNPLFLPAQPSSGTIGGRRVSGQRPSAIRERSTETDKIVFDPLQVARKEEGWEQALQRILLPWLREVLKERQQSTT